jgi:hypothetical protein
MLGSGIGEFVGWMHEEAKESASALAVLLQLSVE